jgi:putative transposase
VRRGLKAVALVISDAHAGLKRAIARVLHGASWQGSRVHFMRNLLSTVPRSAAGAVAAVKRRSSVVGIFPDRASLVRLVGMI